MRVYKPVKERWLALNDDGLLPSREVAEALGCSASYVQILRRQSVSPGQIKCTRCGFLHEDKIPVGEDGLCLWCREMVAGRDPRALYDSGAWQAETDWRGIRDPGEVLRQALYERIALNSQSIAGAATQMKVSEGCLGNFLRGRHLRPQPQSLERMAQYLDVPVEEIQALLV